MIFLEFFTRNGSLLPHSNLANHFLASGLSQGCLFRTSGYSPILLHLLPKWFQFWPPGLSVVSCMAFSDPPINAVFVVIAVVFGFCLSVFLSPSLLWHCKMLQARAVFSCPSPRLSHFSQETWFLS